MLFSSWQFAIFFPTVALLYFLLPYRWRWALLLVASYYFYMCSGPAFALLLAGSTVVDYFVALAMVRIPSRRGRAAFLVVSVLMNLGFLFYFKYFNFFVGSCNAFADWVGMDFDARFASVILPVGISFYTFQTLSYTIDVYRGVQEPERHFGRFALFISFFPQLVAGPIERSTNLLPQFTQRFDFDYDRVASGLRLMAWGLFKKVVIADQLAILVSAVYANPEGLIGPHYVVATVFFAFQIYCDFSGYCDMAIGSARILGFELMLNFDRPYRARSIADFWSRWHISLSTWFRDYLYIPLGGNRVSVPRWYLNLAVVFLVSGLWHGASWTFVIWGALHGGYLIFALATKHVRERMSRLLRLDRAPLLHGELQRIIVFLLVCFAWIFFRAESLSDAFTIVSRLPSGWEQLASPELLEAAREQIGASERYLLTALLLIAVLMGVEGLPKAVGGNVMELIARQHWALRWGAYAGLVLAILNLQASATTPFIYFQF